MIRAAQGASLVRDDRGAAIVEFAFVIPVFLMFVFLILDGGRMLFTQQALNELAAASARCAAIQPTGCTDAAAVQAWTVARGQTRSQLSINAGMVTVSGAADQPSATCFSQPGMAEVTITMPFKSAALKLLPHSIAPSTLTSTSCFPVAVS